MNDDSAVFRTLGLCCARPGQADREDLRAAFSRMGDVEALLDAALSHGMEMLLEAHLRHADIELPCQTAERLRSCWMQSAHRSVVQARALREVAEVLDANQVAMLALKGAALAHTVYSNPRLRPMRDLDVLVPRDRAESACRLLQQIGFAPTMTEQTVQHHLPPLVKIVDGVPVRIEVHCALLPHTPFVPSVEHAGLQAAASRFALDSATVSMPGPEDMLWHVYAHSFVINTLAPRIRLISVADMLHILDAWVDRIDWATIRRSYGRLYRALPYLSQLAPFSDRVKAVLGSAEAAPSMRDLDTPSSLGWSSALSPDVVWLPNWWFRMRYGADSPYRWMWSRALEHTMRWAYAATDTGYRRMRWRLRAASERSHRP